MTKKLSISVIDKAEWPVRDRAAWQIAVRPAKPLDDPGLLSAYPTEQIVKFEAAYGRWLGFLGEAGLDVRIDSGADYFTRPLVSKFVTALNAVLAPCTVRAYLTDLLTAARAMAPGCSIDPLLGATRHIWRTAEAISDKREHLLPSNELYAFGFDVMQSARTGNTPLRAAARYRDGLMIALLAARPLRRTNLASIEIDRHLHRAGDVYLLAFPDAEMKNRRALEIPLPRSLTAPMETYLGRDRPCLIKQHGRWKADPGQALWVSEHGSALSARQVHERIVMRTRERFGFAIHPHLFRDAAATSIAIEDPEHVGIIAAILGHTNFGTGEKFYNQATSIEAARHFQAAIQAFRI